MSNKLEDSLNEVAKEMREDLLKQTAKTDDNVIHGRKINVLGTEYTIHVKSESEDDKLRQVDGYCDKTTKKIVVGTIEKEEDTVENTTVYMNQVLRHEIIHAFLFESGIDGNYEHRPYGHEETMIDWLAIQFPKILKVYKEIGCL